MFMHFAKFIKGRYKYRFLAIMLKKILKKSSIIYIIDIDKYSDLLYNIHIVLNNIQKLLIMLAKATGGNNG